MKIISGTSNPEFSRKIATFLKVDLCNVAINSFNDGEVKININENVRGEDCFIIQSTSRSVGKSVNDNLMELFILTDAVKRGSAKSVNLIIPYFGYQRQDRKDYSRAPISAAVIARFIETLNVNRVIIFDLHAAQISGFFSNNCPVDNLYAEPYFKRYIRQKIIGDVHRTSDIIFVAPDAGAVKTNYRLAQDFEVDTCSFFKNRKNGVIDHMMLIGEVKDKIVVMVDDMIDTAGTICKASNMLKENGAKGIYVFATHGLFSKNALENIEKSSITKVVVSNTIQNLPSTFAPSTKIEQIDVSWMCAESISRLINGESISHLYQNYEYFLTSATNSPASSPSTERATNN